MEHSNPNSYSWCVLRLAVMKIVQCQLQDFLNVAGIELQGEEQILFAWVVFLCYCVLLI